MTGTPPDIPCSCPAGPEHCCNGTRPPGPEGVAPLSAVCSRDRYRVCRISGDRKICARMAQLGVLPGSEIELVCPGPGHQCLVRIMGSTVTLDQLAAESILVTPA